MLDFFRKYQRYIFLLITVVIIISFSFFGTYSTIDSNPNIWREQIAFKAVNGQEITRQELEETANFLSTDNEDKILFGGAWGPNFLNDGVIRKDFVESNLITELALAYSEELKEDFEKRAAKEKKFTLYSHPDAQFLGVESVWKHFSPEMAANFNALKKAPNPLTAEAFKNRVALFAAEKQIPASTLRYILRYQEKQYNWLQPDPKLDQIDLSLFGYHTLEDWFGPRLNRLICEFIINTAILAETHGYRVSKAEALSDLIRNAQISYKQNMNNPNLRVASPEEYFSEQLRRLNIDQSRAIKIWQQVLLFRRYFSDAGSAALLDSLSSEKLNKYAYENVTVDLYRLPKELQISNYEDLQNFEVYLTAVAKRNNNDPVALPEEYLSLDVISKQNPELVQKKYEIELSEATSKKVQARIGLKEIWNWEIADQNWPTLKNKFPDLGVKNATNRDERFDALEKLDPTTRGKVDSFAKEAIVKEHPEWIDQALSEAKPEKMNIGLRSEGGKMPLKGLDSKEKRQSFMGLLDNAPLKSSPDQDSPLFAYSPDAQVYYRITVLEKATRPQILTFAEATADGTINNVRNKFLENYYLSIRDKNPELYKKSTGEWQTFSTVRESVANQYFEKILLAIESMPTKPPSLVENKRPLSREEAGSLRFYPHVAQVKAGVEKEVTGTSKWVKDDKDPASIDPNAQLPLWDQWRITKSLTEWNRQEKQDIIDLNNVASEKPGTWSQVITGPNGDIAFYQIKENSSTGNDALSAVAEQVRQQQKILGDEAQRHLMVQVLNELKSKNALSLAYLKTSEETEVF